MIKDNDKIEVLNLEGATINRLKNNGIFYIKDLINIKYQDLFFIKKIGKTRAKEIKDKLHQVGLTLKDEEKDYKAKIDNLKSNNITLLGDLGLNIKLCYILYKKDIFTFEDLLNNIDNIKEIPNLKDRGESIILDFIKSIKYKEYLSLNEKEDKIKNIAILTKVVSLELEQDLSILLKENLLKELKEVLLELDSILKEGKIERKIYE